MSIPQCFARVQAAPKLSSIKFGKKQEGVEKGFDLRDGSFGLLGFLKENPRIKTVEFIM